MDGLTYAVWVALSLLFGVAFGSWIGAANIGIMAMSGLGLIGILLDVLVNVRHGHPK